MKNNTVSELTNLVEKLERELEQAKKDLSEAKRMEFSGLVKISDFMSGYKDGYEYKPSTGEVMRLDGRGALKQDGKGRVGLALSRGKSRSMVSINDIQFAYENRNSFKPKTETTKEFTGGWNF